MKNHHCNPTMPYWQLSQAQAANLSCRGSPCGGPTNQIPDRHFFFFKPKNLTTMNVITIDQEAYDNIISTLKTLQTAIEKDALKEFKKT